jgi:MFS family permease
MLAAGTCYSFSIYGSRLSDVLGLNQRESAFMAVCGNAALFLSGPLFGMLTDKYQDQLHLFLCFGGICICLGYCLIAATFAKLLSSHFLLLSFYYLLIGLGSGSCYHISLGTNYRNWPASWRSVAVGMSVSLFGLSAFVFSLISRIFVSNNVLKVDQFLYCMGLGCLVLNFISIFIFQKADIDVCNGDSDSEDEHMPENLRLLPEEDSFSELEHDSLPNNETENSINLNTVSCFSSSNAYIIAFAMFSVAGSGVMYINNVGAICMIRLTL